MNQPITVRDAQEADLPALTAIKVGGETLQRDRLRDARGGDMRYLALLVEEQVAGFACLVFRRPLNWSDSGNIQNLPQIIDLQVKETHRGRGFGSAFVHEIETIAASAGFHQLFLSVEPLDNPRAYALYQRLGYRQIQPEPYHETWQFTDSAGVLHSGEEWVVDMVKQLDPGVNEIS